MAKLKVGSPKSQRIAHTLEREIRTGQFAIGDQLASENELVRRFSVSRNTVRKGLEQLSRKGLITTRSGIGSFVTYNGSSIDDQLGWTRALSNTSDVIETRILAIERAVDTKASAFLKLEDCVFLRIDRLRVLKESGVGISLERSRLPWCEAFKTIPRDGLIEDSLNKTLAAMGMNVHSGSEWVGIIAELSPNDAKIMNRQAGAPMLHVRRVTKAADGQIVEYVESTLDPARFGLHMEF